MATNDYVEKVRTLFGFGEGSRDEVTSELLPPMPALDSVQIEITTECNLGCAECSRTKSIAAGVWRNAHMPLERYTRIIEKLPAAEWIRIEGVGEPTLHPDFAEIVRLAADHEKFRLITFNTNAVTHDDEFWVDLAEYPNLIVAVSLDSLDPEVAQRCRAGTDVDLLWDRLLLFQDVFPNLYIAIVASRLNVDDIGATLRKLGKLGTANVYITRVMSEDESVVLQPADMNVLERVVADVRREFPLLAVNFNANDAAEPDRARRCTSPLISPYITIDGLLTPCCVCLDPSVYQNSAVDDDRDWDAIRTDARVAGWVSSFVDADPPMCQGCSLNPNRISLTKTNMIRNMLPPEPVPDVTQPEVPERPERDLVPVEIAGASPETVPAVPANELRSKLESVLAEYRLD